MKALTDRLEWLKMYIDGELGDRSDPKNITLAQTVFIEIQAISDALPEPVLVLKNLDDPLLKFKNPPKRIIELP